MPIIILLLIVIFFMATERYLDSNIFENLFALPTIDLSVLVSLAFLPLLLVLAFTLPRRRSSSHRMITNSAIVALVFVGIVAFYLLYSSKVNAASVGATAAVAATIGWLAQRQAAVDISRKQHTLNILLQLRQSELFNNHRAKIFSVSPDKEIVSPELASQINDERVVAANYAFNETTGIQKLPLIESIRYICNYYEFLSAAIFHGDIDDALLKTSIGPLMAQTYYKFEYVIDLAMTKNRRRSGPVKDSAYYNFWWLIKIHWKMRNKLDQRNLTLPSNTASITQFPFVLSPDHTSGTS
jgi:hypothetical protein